MFDVRKTAEALGLVKASSTAMARWAAALRKEGRQPLRELDKYYPGVTRAGRTRSLEAVVGDDADFLRLVHEASPRPLLSQAQKDLRLAREASQAYRQPVALRDRRVAGPLGYLPG